ncbi:hypothetical protein ElyMa_003943800 [Elysia marginata]|uniref:VASP tetramerisation domain-containing protein n=1 Tax=Elysia marginata TaxID=1093978 RepID=A0AAV4FUN4_9GAST|nr:hypothetical protein ElyMa_003943800 [Elysia marginata]
MDNDALTGEDIPLLMDQVEIQPESSAINAPSPLKDIAHIKAELQQAGEMLIQEIIDEQLVQVEAALSRQLREKLKNIIGKLDY